MMGNSMDPVPAPAWPILAPTNSTTPVMPLAWSATALLHPFSPPPPTDPVPAVPFYQLCVANLQCVRSEYFSAQLSGADGRTWWYLLDHSGTQLSTDGGATWTTVEMGWTLPDNWFGEYRDQAACAGQSPLNYLATNAVEWWKVPVPDKANPSAPKGATWMWFDAETQNPVRMMFGEGPITAVQGDPGRLALFQMFSFSYLPVFHDLSATVPDRPRTFVAGAIPGFSWGNPDQYEPFSFGRNFGFTALMTPVNEAFNPFPTRVLYVWKDIPEYARCTDRAQHTRMNYSANPASGVAHVDALLTGPAPAGVEPPPSSGSGFLTTYPIDGTPTCVDGSQFPFAQEAPDWIANPAVGATIQATITDNPVLGPATTLTVWSVLFPPATKYPQGTYLWTWYAPVPGSGGRQSRPVTFMQSESGVGVGTSLALADYFYHAEFEAPIPPALFEVPSVCAAVTPARAPIA